jgi:hypothetical protein
MDTKAALKRQYHATLAMLRQTIEVCPNHLWIEGESPRSFWRIAYHAIYYGHWYLQRNSEDFQRWELSREHAASLWTPPTDDLIYTKEEILAYCTILEEAIDSGVDALDLEADSSGFDWYDMPKLDHQLVNLRHIQQHVGQLSERLMTAGIETNWVGGARKAAADDS